jgi:hypothetical protein
MLIKRLIPTILLACNGVASAQACQPFWVKPDPFDRIPYWAACGINTGPAAGLYASAGDWMMPPLASSWVARWRGQGWEPLIAGTGYLAGVVSLRALDDGTGPKPYLRTSQYVQGVGFVRKGWRWEGTQWVETPPALFGQPPATYAEPWCSFDDGSGMAIYGFHNASIAKWIGSNWQSLGGQIQNTTKLDFMPADLGHGPRLVAVGSFTAIGSVPLQGAASWDGQQWTQLGQGIVVGGNRGLEVFNGATGPNLYLAGLITVNGNNAALVRFDGQSWAAVPHAPLGIKDLKSFDDGSGVPGLFMVGDFSTVNGMPAARIVKFDGTNWYPLGAGTGYFVENMTVYNDGRGPSLFVTMGGGENSPTGGGHIGSGTAQWVGCPNCYADCDNSQGSKRLNANDFMCFINRYVMRDPYANCTVDESINVLDFVCFMNKFAAGCP